MINKHAETLLPKPVIKPGSPCDYCGNDGHGFNECIAWRAHVAAAVRRRRDNRGWPGMVYPYSQAVEDAIVIADAFLALQDVSEPDDVPIDSVEIGKILYDRIAP
jgi:hypothetical protein